ncbi:baseplate J/gp47 family protein [Achromobacter sp. 413638]|uniref:baseplate J/gp47 family protein n=1 Tax=Achromobacter sp. 413638 TaxID=3342385 RepID=UPI00370AD42B
MAITTTAPTVDATGIHAPTYADVLNYLQTQFRAIYGADVYLGSDSQDGQFLAILASAINDTNTVAVQVYNSFSPAKGIGEALSSNVKINGIKRAKASASTVDLRIVGQAGTTIVNGIAKDANQQQWALPATVVVPPAGEVTVTASSTQQGAVSAAAGTITQIGTPTLGWQSVTNPAAATPGAPVESDAALRVRQAVSVALPSRTVLEGTVGAVASIAGVARYRAYENDTSATDGNGIPSHSISLVVDGGDAMAIASAIAAKKTPGTGTYGTTTEIVTDIYGIAHPIRFFRPTTAPITAALTIKALTGYTTAVGGQIKDAVVAYVNAVAIGGGLSGSVEWGDAITAANSVGGGTVYKLVSLTLSGPSGAGTPDVPLAFNAAAAMTPAAIVLTVI